MAVTAHSVDICAGSAIQHLPSITLPSVSDFMYILSMNNELLLSIYHTCHIQQRYVMIMYKTSAQLVSFIAICTNMIQSLIMLESC